MREEAPAAKNQGIAVKRSLSHALSGLGQRVRCVLELSPLPPGTRLEVPVPGGCRLLTNELGAELRGGVLHLEPRASRVELDLVTRHPGRYLVLPARARARDGSWGTSQEARLEIKSEP